MASLKISLSPASSTHSIDSLRHTESVTSTSSLPAVMPQTPQLASKTHKSTASAARRKSFQSGSNVKSRDELVSPIPRLKSLAVMRSGSIPVQKASSIQNFKKNDAPMKRTQSAQNIDLAITVRPGGSNVSKCVTVKRAASSQNVSSKGRQRISAPVSAMAYNAELLASFEKEKKMLERRISELIQVGETRMTENEKLKFELRNLKERLKPENIEEEFEVLRQENNQLRDKLLEANIPLEHLTDADALLQLPNRSGRYIESFNQKSGAVGGNELLKFSSASDADSNSKDVESLGDPSCLNAEVRSCVSLDANWDKQSNKSSEGGQSEVASLQDRILQMEETHYSTNEELQATLQELTDLQDTVNELSAQNERLADERNVLLETLCAQTEKLENARLQVEQLKDLLFRDSKSGDRSEFECQLTALVRSAQEEKEELLLKQFELSNVVQSLENENFDLKDTILAQQEKSQFDRVKLEGLVAENKTLENQLSTLREQGIKDTMDFQHLKALFENEKQKVVELEQERSITSRSELEVLMDSTRQQKDRLEEKLTNDEQELLLKQNEISKLKEALDITKAELKDLSEGIEEQMMNWQTQLRIVEQEKEEVEMEMLALQEKNDELQLNCDQFVEEKKTYTMTVARAESELRMMRSKMARNDADYKEQIGRFLEERDSWKQFQQDLQMAVVVANNLKTESQEDLSKINADREKLREQNRMLKRELDAAVSEISRLKEEYQQQQQLAVESAASAVSSLDIRGKVLSTVDRELAARRQGRMFTEAKGLAPSLSVKHLISSIEQQVKNETLTVPTSPSISNPVVLRLDSSENKKNLLNVKSSDPPSRLATQRQTSNPSTDSSLKSVIRRTNADSKEARTAGHRHTIANIVVDGATVTDDDKRVAVESKSPPIHGGDALSEGNRKPLTGILSNKNSTRRKTTSGVGDIDRSPEKSGNHLSGHLAKSDPLAVLAKQFNCSKRNALLKWCQNKTATYAGIDITNFSSSWNDGLAFCALMHTFLPDVIPYKELNSQDKVGNFTLAFKAADSVGIQNTLNLTEILATERPDWQAIMSYVTNIYRHFEADSRA